MIRAERWRGAFAAGLALAALLGTGIAVASGVATESEVKAAFLFNFARYVEWPDSNEDRPITIGVLGDEDFPPVLERVVRGKEVRDREVQVKRLRDTDDLRSCHIVYIGSDQAARQGEIRQSLSGASVFSVADFGGFAEAGGTANFVRSGNKVRFEINEGVARQAGLKVSSRLLRLATLVN